MACEIIDGKGTVFPVPLRVVRMWRDMAREWGTDLAARKMRLEGYPLEVALAILT
jgi:hypothetical protein